jgi:hypothetical protein
MSCETETPAENDVLATNWIGTSLHFKQRAISHLYLALYKNSANLKPPLSAAPVLILTRKLVQVSRTSNPFIRWGGGGGSSSDKQMLTFHGF